MRKILILLFLFSIIPQFSFARRCTKCGGSGKMIIFRGDMSGYGLNTKKRQCPICKEWITVGIEHREICTRCGGSGDYETAGDRAIESVRNGRVEEADEGLSYLTPAELSQFEALKETLKGHSVRVDCSSCNASGKCRQCNGSGYAFGMMCPICSGSRLCIACHGTGIARWEHVYPTEEEKKLILNRMASLVSSAVKRGEGMNPTDNEENEEYVNESPNENTREVNSTVSDEAKTKKEELDEIPFIGWLLSIIFLIIFYKVFILIIEMIYNFICSIIDKISDLFDI